MRTGHGARRRVATGAALFTLACAVRFAYVASIADAPEVRYPVLDALAYHEWALRILAGEWLGDRIYYQDPLYPFFLAGLYACFGPGSIGVLLAQSALDAATVVLVWVLAGRLFADERVALLAGLLACFNAVSVYYAALLLKAPLLLFLFTASLVLLVRAAARDRAGAWLGAGWVFGVACLTRGNALLFLPALGLWSLGDRGSTPAWRVARPLWVAAGVGLALLPIALRNYAIGGEWVLVNSQAGQNFYIGQFRGNDTGAYRAPPFLHATPAHEEEDFRAEAEKAVGRPLTPAETSRYWWRRGLAEIAADPAHFARHTARKLLVLANDAEVPDNYSFAFTAEHAAPWLRGPWPRWGLLLPPALLGMAWARRRRPATLVMSFAAAYALGLLVFFNLSRLRLPLVPVVVVFAASGALELWRRVRGGGLRGAAPALLFLALGWSVTFLDLGGEAPTIRLHNLAQAQQLVGRQQRDRAAALSAAGNEAAAAAALRESDRERDLAEATYRRGLAVDPRSARLREGLRGLLEMRLVEAQRLGLRDVAMDKATALTQEFPDYAEGFVRLGLLLAEQGRLPEAQAAADRALALDPASDRAKLLALRVDQLRRGGGSDAASAPGDAP